VRVVPPKIVPSADKPTTEELRERLASRASVTPSEPPADAVRAERDNR